MSNAFNGAREPLRAIRDLIVFCEELVMTADETAILERAQAALTTLRAIHGDARPAEDIAAGPMVEPSVS